MLSSRFPGFDLLTHQDPSSPSIDCCGWERRFTAWYTYWCYLSIGSNEGYDGELALLRCVVANDRVMISLSRPMGWLGRQKSMKAP